jgi:hypothetical protein
MNAKWIKVIVFLSVGIFFVTTCGSQPPQTVRGSGHVVTDTQQVSGFDRVSLSGIMVKDTPEEK